MAFAVHMERPAARRGALRIAITNYTGNRKNWGCQSTSIGLANILAKCSGRPNIGYLELKSRVGSFLKCSRRELRKEVLSYCQTGRSSLVEGLYEAIYQADERALLAASDLILFQGEGTMVGTNFYNAESLLIAPVVAKVRHNKEVWSVNQTIFSLDAEFSEFLAGAYNRIFSVVSVREPASLRFAHAIGIRGCKLVPDFAFSEIQPGSPPTRGRYAAMSGMARIERVPVAQCLQVASALIERYGHLVFMASTPQDLAMAQDLKHTLGGGFEILSDQVSREDVYSAITSADIFVSGRYHMNIFAAKAGVPFVPVLSNTHKNIGLNELLSYPVAPVQSDRVDAIIDNIDAVRDQHRQLSRHLLERSARVIRFVNSIQSLERLETAHFSGFDSSDAGHQAGPLLKSAYWTELNTKSGAGRAPTSGDAAPDTRSLIEKARDASNRKDWNAAGALWRAVLDDIGSKQKTMACSKLVQALEKAGRTEESRHVLSDGLKRFPNSILLLSEKARLLSQGNDWSKAQAMLERAKTGKWKMPAPSYRLLIECHQRQAQAEKALAVAEEAVAVHPNQETLRRELSLTRDTLSALDRLKADLSSLAGQSCIVFGSAPEPDFGSRGFSGEKIICCNGSARALQDAFGLVPNFSLIHSHVFVREIDSDREVREALAGTRDAGKKIVLTSRKYRMDSDPTRKTFDWSYRFHIIERLLDAPMPFLDFSTGAFAVLAALYAGASEVRLVGFSLNSKGHSYNGNARYRNHVSSDAALYALLSARGYELVSDVPEIATICRRIIN